jgi:putative transposase
MPFKDQPVKEAIMVVLKGCKKGRKKVIRMVQRIHPEMKSSKIRRVYVDSGLSLYRPVRKRRVSKKPEPLAVPMAKNEEWAMDFMSDRMVDGRPFRTLNLIDEYDRYCLNITVDTSINARRVTRELERVIESQGKPMAIRTDNGPEFTSKWFQCWLKSAGIKWSAIEKGEPSQNAFIERFNRTLREDVLDANLFFNLSNARRNTESFQREYNTRRPHEALNYMTPCEVRR